MDLLETARHGRLGYASSKQAEVDDRVVAWTRITAGSCGLVRNCNSCTAVAIVPLAAHVSALGWEDFREHPEVGGSRLFPPSLRCRADGGARQGLERTRNDLARIRESAHREQISSWGPHRRRPRSTRKLTTRTRSWPGALPDRS